MVSLIFSPKSLIFQSGKVVFIDLFFYLFWIEHEIPEDKNSRSEQDESAQPYRHFSMSCDESFKECCHQEHGHQPHHDLDPVFGPFTHAVPSRSGTGKQDAVAEDDAGRTCDHDGGDLQCAVNEYYEDRLHAQPVLEKIILE